MENQKDNKLMTASEAAEILSCSKQTVYRMVKDKTLTPVYLRPNVVKSMRFRSADIYEFINK